MKKNYFSPYVSLIYVSNNDIVCASDGFSIDTSSGGGDEISIAKLKEKIQSVSES